MNPSVEGDHQDMVCVFIRVSARMYMIICVRKLKTHFTCLGKCSLMSEPSYIRSFSDSHVCSLFSRTNMNTIRFIHHLLVVCTKYRNSFYLSSKMFSDVRTFLYKIFSGSLFVLCSLERTLIP
jgi:hypothetical protein